MAETTTPAGLPIASPKFMLYGKSNTQITFAVSGGSLWLSVNQERNRAFSKSMTPAAIAFFKSELKKLKAAAPGYISTTVAKSRDNTEKWAPGQQIKYNLDYVIKVTKGDNMVYTFELTDNKQTVFTAPIMCAHGIGSGSEPFGDADRSGLGLDMLIDWFTLTVPVALVLTNKPREYKPNAGGQGGGASPAASGSAAAGWDDGDQKF